MPGETLQVGPFSGGLNTQADPSSIADTELVDCVNLELDHDHSLIVRPPIQNVSILGKGTSGRIRMLGVAVFSDVHYYIASDDDKTYWRTVGDWTEIGTNLISGAMVQYGGKVWLIPAPGETTDGGSWDPVGGFTADADIPNGRAAAIYKERLFVVPGHDATTDESRLKFSNAGDFGVWGASDFIDISKGDGQNLVDLVVFRSNLILFKEQSTYIMSYDGTPFDAIIEMLNSTIGPSHANCIAVHENSVFVHQEGKVYELLNFDFQQINIKVPFFVDMSTPALTTRGDQVFLSAMGDRLIARYFNRVYVYGLRTKTWTRWESANPELHNFGPLVGHPHHATNDYFAGSSLNENDGLYRIKNELDVATDERSSMNFEDQFTRSIIDGWGTSDSGHTWIVDSTVTEFDVNGTDGLITYSIINNSRLAHISNLSVLNQDFQVQIQTDQLSLGATQNVGVMFRYLSFADTYYARLAFNTDQSIAITWGKRVGGVEAAFPTVATGLVHAANTDYTLRIQAVGNRLRVKAWLSSLAEPTDWMGEVFDSDIMRAGSVGVRTHLSTGNTNGTVIHRYDGWVSFPIPEDIICSIRTKNYNIAASHVFKRLNLWGVDILTNRPITGIVTPIVNNARISWSFLKSQGYKWSQLKGQSWAFPTGGVIFTEDADVDTGTGAIRKFVKFVRALRYRLVNFQVIWPANGTTSEGPAKLFWLVIKTSTRQLVSKKVS